MAQITATMPMVIIITARVRGGRGGGVDGSPAANRVGGRTSASTLPTTRAPPSARTSSCRRLVVPPKRSLAAEAVVVVVVPAANKDHVMGATVSQGRRKR